MEDIYKLCDRIINNKILSIESLKMTLTGISKGGKAIYRRKSDTFVSRAQAMNYRAKKAGVKGKVSPTELYDLITSNPKCNMCGSIENLVFDHIKPMYRGGSNSIDNIQILCAKCNMEKGVN